MNRTELILKLIKAGHLNVVERQDLSPLAIRTSELEAIIIAELQQEPIFPRLAKTEHEGEAIYEGAYLEKTLDGRCLMHIQRPFAFDLFTLAEHKVKSFRDTISAVRAYIKLEWRDNIDGIPIIKG